MDVTLAWMLGVVSMMIIFAVFALIGYIKVRAQGGPDQISKEG